jgi:hypothetical protein
MKIMYPGLKIQLRAEGVCVVDKILEVRSLTELQCTCRADIHAAGLIPTIVQQVGAARAFLGKVERLIEIDRAVRAGIHAKLTSRAFLRINDVKSVIPFIDGSFNFAFVHTGSVLTVHTHFRKIGNHHLWYGPSDRFLYAYPELTGIRLGFGIGGPVVACMLVFAGYLTAVASVADR